MGKGVPGYVTPKVAIGAAVGNDNGEMLLVQRADSGVWLYPTGWADVGYSAAEVVVKEVEEETGIEVEVVRLIAVLDGLRIGISRIPLYSLVFQCRAIGGELQAHPLEMRRRRLVRARPPALPPGRRGALGSARLRRVPRRAHRGAVRLGAVADLARRSRQGLRPGAVGAAVGSAKAGASRALATLALCDPPGSPHPGAGRRSRTGAEPPGDGDRGHRGDPRAGRGVRPADPPAVVVLTRLRAGRTGRHGRLVGVGAAVARDGSGAIVGSLTLALFRVPTGLRAWIEDVVVDESARGPVPVRRWCSRRWSGPRPSGRIGRPDLPAQPGGGQPTLPADGLRAPHHQRLPAQPGTLSVAPDDRGPRLRRRPSEFDRAGRARPHGCPR